MTAFHISLRSMPMPQFNSGFLLQIWRNSLIFLSPFLRAVVITVVDDQSISCAGMKRCTCSAACRFRVLAQPDRIHVLFLSSNHLSQCFSYVFPITCLTPDRMIVLRCYKSGIVPASIGIKCRVNTHRGHAAAKRPSRIFTLKDSRLHGEPRTWQHQMPKHTSTNFKKDLKGRIFIRWKGYVKDQQGRF